MSDSKIVFKVKTTQPSWYYVRPNQATLEVGKTEDVVIIIVEEESNKFLDQAANNESVKLEKHRFLVQSKAISEEEYALIQGLTPVQRSNEYTKIWNTGAKDDRSNIKLKVDFAYPDASSNKGNVYNSKDVSSGASSGAKKPGGNSDLGQNDAPAESSFSRGENAGMYDDVGKFNDESRGVRGAAPLEKEGVGEVYIELQNLRKKFDAVVEYTVHLTADRDNIVAQLTETKRELSGLRSSGEAAGGKATRTYDADRKTTETRKSTKGFSLFFVILIALIAYIFGRFFA